MERGSSDWPQLFKWELAFLVALKFLVNERFPMIWWRFQKIYATRAFMCHRLEPSPKIIPWKAVASVQFLNLICRERYLCYDASNFSRE